MRHQRKIVGLIATACVLALSATPALAHEFVASASGKVKGVAQQGSSKETVIGPNTQELKLGTFKVYCNKATAKGAVAAGASKTFATSVKFAWCWTPVKFGAHTGAVAVHMVAPLAIEYHANGFVETGSELEEVEGSATLKGGEAEFKANTGINSEFEKSTCTIKWIEQTIPVKAEKKPELEYSSVTYSNEEKPATTMKRFPDGFQHYIKVSNAFKGIKYEYEGEPCEEWGKEEGAEGGGGTYTGSFTQTLNTGDFEFR
jgi:hypothetical protein